MLIAFALLALTHPYTHPDHSFDPAFEQGQPPGAPAVRVAGTAEETAKVAALLQHQDECLLAHRSDLAKEDYADDFVASDYHCDSSEEILARWDDFIHEHRDVELSHSVLRTDRVGDYLVATVRRPFKGVRLVDDQPVEDASCETMVLLEKAGRLRIRRLWDTDEEKLAQVDREKQRWVAPGLALTARLPETFVAIPRTGPLAALCQLCLIDPTTDTTIGLMVWDPTIESSDLDSMMHDDFSTPGAEWLAPPSAWNEHAAFRGSQGDVRYRPASLPDQIQGPKFKLESESYERAIYLTPDDRMIIAVWVHAPPSVFLSVRDRVDDFAKGLQLLRKPGDRRPWHQRLFELNPTWNTVDRGVFTTSVAPIEMAIPKGLTATPLAGDHFGRLRLRVDEDPGTTIVVRVFPAGEKLPFGADDLLDRTVHKMESVACSLADSGVTRTSGTIDFLGKHGESFAIEVVCRDGARRTFRIAAVDRDDGRVQVQLFPGSDQRELQDRCLQQVLQALHVRTAVKSTEAAQRAGK